MTVLDAFLVTWSRARATFGTGTPQTGAAFDNSGTLRELASTLQSAAPESGWSGVAATTYGAANAEHRRVIGELAALDQRLASEVDRSAQAVEAGRRNLDAVRKWVIDAASAVPTNAAGRQIQMVIVQKGLVELQDIIQRSNGELTTIGRNVRGIGDEYQALDNPEIRGDAPDEADDTKSADEVGNDDSEALQNGRLSTEQRDRLVAHTTLSPEQQSALNSGKLTLPPEQMSYLQGFSRAFGDKTPAEIKTIMDRAGADGTSVADVFQLASNANIRTGLPSVQPPSTTAPSGGGKYALPEGIRNVLDGPVLTPLGVGEPVHRQDGSISLPEITAPSQPASGLNDLADIIQRGNRDLQVGSALDSGLFDKGQQLLEQSNSWPVPGNDPISDRPRWYHQTVDPTLQNMFNAVNPDDMVIHDAITGAGGERFLNNLTQHQWQDDGLAAGGLFDWVSESAAHDTTGHAADTAHALAQYASSHSSQLLNLPDTQARSLGQVNPELTRDWARALSPYFDDMVGMNAGDSSGSFASLDLEGGNLEPVNARHVMSVLSSDHPPLDRPIDPHAPATASQIAMKGAQAHIDSMLTIAAHSVSDGTPGEDNFAMKAAGKLQAAMDLGAYDERFDATHDALVAARESYEMRSRLFDLGKDLAAEIPGGGIPAALGGFMKDFLVGAEPVMPGVDNIRPRDMFPVQMYLATVLASDGAGEPELRAAVEHYLMTNQLSDPGQQSSLSSNRKFYNDITSYLSTVGNENILNTMMDEYWRAYSGAITNASPPK